PSVAARHRPDRQNNRQTAGRLSPKTPAAQATVVRSRIRTPLFFASHSSACFIQATNHAGHDGSSDISEVYHTERRLGGCKVWNGTRKKRSPPSGGLPSRLSLDVQAQRVQQRAVGKPVIIVIPPHAAVFF